MKTPTQAKKESLIAFIEHKMKHGGDSDAVISATVNRLKKMSYKALERWAQVNGFIG